MDRNIARSTNKMLTCLRLLRAFTVNTLPDKATEHNGKHSIIQFFCKLSVAIIFFKKQVWNRAFVKKKKKLSNGALYTLENIFQVFSFALGHFLG